MLYANYENFILSIKKEYDLVKDKQPFSIFINNHSKNDNYYQIVNELKNNLIQKNEQYKNILSNVDIHVIYLSEILKIDLNKRKEIEFKKIIFDIEKPDFAIDNNIQKSCLFASKLIKKSFSKLFKKYSLVFRNENSRIMPKEKLIIVNYNTNNLLRIVSDFMHEVGHLIEYESVDEKNNKILLQKNIYFLKKRIGNTVMEQSPNKVVYKSTFKDPYVATLWLDPFQSYLNLPYTEISSYGLGYLIYNPIDFLVGDPDYFVYLKHNYIS